MRCIAVIGHLISHPRFELEGAPIAQFGVELTFQDVENMTAVTPVISNIVRSVLRKCIITLPRPIPGRRLMKPGRGLDQCRYRASPAAQRFPAWARPIWRCRPSQRPH